MRRLVRALVAFALLAAITPAHPAFAKPDRVPRTATLAIIGDTPYGAEDEADFPGLVETINDDPDVSAVVHLGDIKTGSSPCTNEYFAYVRGQFDAFADPFIFTPGDNEWTDCHRPAAGGYVPTERLSKLRDVFFPRPGVTLGRPFPLAAQPELVENVRWSAARAVLATLHVVGSNNGLAPWFGAAETAEQRALRLAEVNARTAANLEWIDATFAAAARERAKGVVLLMQADMWDGDDQSGFGALKERIAWRASQFRNPVLLLQGDSHRYKVDQPLPLAPNVTRIVVEGEQATEYLRLTVDPRGGRRFRWERVDD